MRTEIEIKQVTSWVRALNAARWTVGKNPVADSHEVSDNFKHEMMISSHSPKRLVEYDIRIKNIPYCNAVHFVRHHVGIEKFQCSLRDDRNEEIDDRRKLPQDYPVNLWMSVNAEALVNISQMRLCNLADVKTKYIWYLVKQEMMEVDPIVAKYMVKQCIYRGFCPEKRTCHFDKTESFRMQLESYRHYVK